jgi:hypothetical protein
MNTETNEQQAAQEAGSQYGAMAADLSLVHISVAANDEAIQEHIADLVRNIREQAKERAGEGLGNDLATIWKDAALEAAQARLRAYEEAQQFKDEQQEIPADKDPAG